MARRLALALFVAALAGTQAGNLEAQIPIARKVSSGPVDASTRVLVANPYLAEGNTADAVKIGAGLRDRFAKVVGAKYTVIPREMMNVALKHFGFQGDDVIPVESVSALAGQVKAGIQVVTKVTPAGGGYEVTAEVHGMDRSSCIGVCRDHVFREARR